MVTLFGSLAFGPFFRSVIAVIVFLCSGFKQYYVALESALAINCESLFKCNKDEEATDKRLGMEKLDFKRVNHVLYPVILSAPPIIHSRGSKQFLLHTPLWLLKDASF